MRKLPHYFTLLVILSASVLGFVLFSWDRYFQISLVTATVFSYASWGVVHHFLHDDLYFEVVVEYLGIAVLGGVLVVLLLI